MPHLKRIYSNIHKKQIIEAKSLGNHSQHKGSSYVIKHVKIPNSVKKIGNYAFHECSSLKQITIPSSVKNSKSNIFTRCSSLPK